MTHGVNNLETDWSLFSALMQSSVVDWTQSTNYLTNLGEVTGRTYMQSVWLVQWACHQKVKTTRTTTENNNKPQQQQKSRLCIAKSPFICKDPCGSTFLNVLESREVSELVYCWISQPSQVMCVSKQLKCWEARTQPACIMWRTSTIE